MADTDISKWHQPIEATQDADFSEGAIRVFEGDTEMFARFDAMLKSLPRTKVVAGELTDGRVTYLTRTPVFRFPDYTTIQQSDGLIKMYARLRFGKSDLGVNRKRLERVISSVQQK